MMKGAPRVSGLLNKALSVQLRGAFNVSLTAARARLFFCNSLEAANEVLSAPTMFWEEEVDTCSRPVKMPAACLACDSDYNDDASPAAGSVRRADYSDYSQSVSHNAANQHRAATVNRKQDVEGVKLQPLSQYICNEQ